MSEHYCPQCGEKLINEDFPYDTNEGGLIIFEGWCECPTHGEVHIEFYRPSGESTNVES